MATKEEIREAKRKLEEAINKEFPRPEQERRFLEENRFDDLAILLTSKAMGQNISPKLLITMINSGNNIGDILKYAKEAEGKKLRINQFIADCYNLQDLCRK